MENKRGHKAQIILSLIYLISDGIFNEYHIKGRGIEYWAELGVCAQNREF